MKTILFCVATIAMVGLSSGIECWGHVDLLAGKLCQAIGSNTVDTSGAGCKRLTCPKGEEKCGREAVNGRVYLQGCWPNDQADGCVQKTVTNNQGTVSGLQCTCQGNLCNGAGLCLVSMTVIVIAIATHVSLTAFLS